MNLKKSHHNYLETNPISIELYKRLIKKSMSPLGEFLILVITFTGLTLFYSIKQFEESKPSKLFNPNTK